MHLLSSSHEPSTVMGSENSKMGWQICEALMATQVLCFGRREEKETNSAWRNLLREADVESFQSNKEGEFLSLRGKGRAWVNAQRPEELTCPGDTEKFHVAEDWGMGGRSGEGYLAFRVELSLMQ